VESGGPFRQFLTLALNRNLDLGFKKCEQDEEKD